ncbi:GNAT family N-acetyltransferase [Microlunatus sp. Gsoil 973]|uniref:GNAT family N-acetyltransferase n=1 Tax=Microlunatus sp. Gsoil 973 TaxID=2672569 RepID=UPI0012B4F0A1|nr:GNAT family N-acetyltransferase [Microlunatus sp. Gsoil 973]QGN33189.1 GNAT family N-acetyltransferase [Microlunatus sp. Gsoil 973]
MSDIEIRELTVPEAEGAAGWDELVGYAELSNQVVREDTGVTDLDEPPKQVLARLRDPYTASRVFGVYRGDRMVGFGEVESEREQTIAWLWAGIVAAERRRRLGSQLVEVLTGAAVEAGATTLQAGTYHTDLDSEPRLASPSGPGSIPAADATTQFLRARGFGLGQVEIMSALSLPVSEDRLTELAGLARPADDYELIDWTGATPPGLLDGYAKLRTIVSTAVPTGELAEEQQVWDADRVRSRDEQNARAGLITTITVARHRPTGDLVAFTALARPAGASGRAVTQGYTMVLPEHRGHNLGMRIKINNLRRLMTVDDLPARIITGNAGENEAMLRINLALGFRPFVVAGWWEKKLVAG